MEIIEANVEYSEKIQAYFKTQRMYVPYYYHTRLNNFIKSFFVESIDGELIFKDLISKIIIDHDKVIGVIQYGILNYDLLYDGEKIEVSDVGDLRIMSFDYHSIKTMYKLLNEMFEYFKVNKIKKIYAFEHAFGLSCNARIGKLYYSERLCQAFLLLKGFKKANTSILLTKNFGVQDIEKKDDGINFIIEEEDNVWFYHIKKYLVEVGGCEVMIVDDGKKAYLNYFYILDKHQSHHFGHEAFNALIYDLKQKHINIIDTDIDELNGMGLNFYEKVKMVKLGNCYSYLKEIK